MSRRRAIISILSLTILVTALPVVSQEQIPLSELVQAALEESLDLADARVRTRLSEIARDTVVSTTTPDVTLTADPAYGLRTQRGSNFASITDVSDFPPSNVSTVTHTAGLSVEARQLLPTAGVAVGSVGTSFSASVSDADSDSPTTTFSLAPSASLSLSQPLFVDGNLIDVSQFRLNRESADASLAAARTGEEALRQQVVLQTVQLASQRESLRRAAQLQQEQQELLRLQLEQARVRQNQGQGSAQQISALEIQLNRARDAELRNTLAARELALGLERLTGRTVPEQSIIVFPDATGGADHDDGREGGDSGLADGVRSPQVARAESELRAAEADYQLARKQAGATANLAITATPRYRDEREDPEDPATVFSDFTGDGSGVDLNLVLTLEIPLTEGGARRRAVEQAQLSLELAESALERTRREQDSQSVLAELRIETLAQRIELLEFELAFEREQLQSDRELQELGSATRVDIARRLLTITGRENELANLRTELLLQQLELIRLRGDDPATFVLREKTE